MNILFDGFNLALKEGTGIAVYTRNTVAAARILGHEVGVLYDKPRVAQGRDVSVEQRALSFAQQVMLASSTRSKFTSYRLAVSAFLNHLRISTPRPHAHQLPATIVYAGQNRLLPNTTVLNHEYVFDTAFLKHALFGSEYRVHAHGHDIFHMTSAVPIRAVDAATVVTIHDVIPITHPASTETELAGFHSLVGLTMRKADSVITVSEHSKKAILEVYPDFPEEKIHVTYQHIDLADAVGSIDADGLTRELNARQLKPGGYILCLGALEPKKNFARAIKAYLGSGLDLPLVIVGKNGWLHEDVDRALSGLEVSSLRDASLMQGQPHVRRIEYVTYQEVLALISGARILFFPSIAEGFGLPLLEAMTLGCPFLTSNTSCLPEIAGGAGLCVDPYDVTAMSHALAELCNNSDLRQKAIDEGHKQAKRFSKEAHATRLAEAYEYALRVFRASHEE